MPVIVTAPSDRARLSRPSGGSGEPLQIGLVNNMPDSAAEATEWQFRTLLEAAAGDEKVVLHFCQLPNVPRGPAMAERFSRLYWPLEFVLEGSLDGVIVTGMEPRAALLRDEPYWADLAALVDWAERSTRSSIWSCLAAHGAVEHLSGIRRNRLQQKCCGVFDYSVRPHALTQGLSQPLRTPQSRWNELRASELAAAGYTLLSDSATAGCNIFARQSGSLLVFLQGHLEYDRLALLKEFRRDVQRFLAGEYAAYPSMPAHYFGKEAQDLLESFRHRALSTPEPDQLDFPLIPESLLPPHVWHPDAVRLYVNWLEFLRRP